MNHKVWILRHFQTLFFSNFLSSVHCPICHKGQCSVLQKMINDILLSLSWRLCVNTTKKKVFCGKKHDRHDNLCGCIETAHLQMQTYYAFQNVHSMGKIWQWFLSVGRYQSIISSACHIGRNVPFYSKLIFHIKDFYCATVIMYP